jgi:hypothetical protein
MERNKSKPPVKTEPITIGDDSDSSIEHFLAREGFDNDEPPYDFVDNLPPCLQDNPYYPSIKSSFETRGETSKPSPAQKVTAPCDQCGLWLERYYLDIPKLQSKIQDLESQVARLAGRNDKGHPNDKNQLTTGSILFKNVESATAIVNSKLALTAAGMMVCPSLFYAVILCALLISSTRLVMHEFYLFLD